MRKKYILLLLVVVFSVVVVSCQSDKSTDTAEIAEAAEDEEQIEKTKYVNKEHSFRLMIPKSMMDSDLFEIRDKPDKYDNGSAVEFVFGKMTEEKIYVGGVLFEVVICDKNVSFEKGELLNEEGEKSYYFIMTEATTESSSFNEFIKKQQSMTSKIKSSFSRIEKQNY